MSNDSIAVRNISASFREAADSWMAERARLMAELEASLLCSRKALLAMDLAGIERQTGEQRALIRKFEKLLVEGRLAQPSQLQSEKDTRSAAHLWSPGLEEKVRRKANQMAEATRLQAALLTRAQCKLRILANMLAGSSVIYGPFQNCGRPLTADSFSAAGERG
jgi:hypothetical protein